MAQLSQNDLVRIRGAMNDPSITPQQQQALLGILKRSTETSTAPVNPPLGGGAVAETAPPATLQELTGGFVNRGTLEALGGTAGSILGAGAGAAGGPLAPATVPGGILAGGGLGAAAGSLVFDNIENALRGLGVLQGENPTLPEAAQSAAQAGAQDVTFGGGGQVLGQAFRAIKPGLGKLLGLRNEGATQIIRSANQAGIPVGAVDVTQDIPKTATRGFANVLGVFPYIGGPFKKQGQIKGQAISDAVARTLNRLAPNASLGSQLGLDIGTAARNSMGEFRNTSARLYDSFREKAAKASTTDIFPTDDIATTADDIFNVSEKGRIVLKNGEELPSVVAKEVTDYIGRLRNLPDLVNINQIGRLSDDLQDLVSSLNTAGFDVKKVSQIRESIEQSMNNIRADLLPEGEAADLVKSLSDANEFYANNITKFQTPTAQTIGKVDKNIFRPGPVRPGSLTDDQLQNAFANIKSPQGVKDLRALVGDESINKLARNKFQSALDSGSVTDELGELQRIDWPKVVKSLGLSKEAGGQPEVFAELVRTTGVKPKEIADFLKTAARVKVSSDVSRFIARRAILGGFSAGAGAATGTALIKDSKLKSLALALTLRNFSDIIANPAQLKEMRRAFQPDTPTNIVRGILGRFIENANQKDREQTAVI